MFSQIQKRKSEELNKQYEVLRFAINSLFSDNPPEKIYTTENENQSQVNKKKINFSKFGIANEEELKNLNPNLKVFNSQEEEEGEA